MRIISGNLKGRKLKVPSGLDVRPTSDRVKEAVFSSLGQVLNNATVLDLFAGSGSLGLESLSRGARWVTFIEKSARTLSVLKSNISTTNSDDQCNLIHGDCIWALSKLKKNNTYDIIFMDPPYDTNLLHLAFIELKKYKLLKTTGIIIAEHSKNYKFRLPIGLHIVRTKSYGDTSISTLTFLDKT